VRKGGVIRLIGWGGGLCVALAAIAGGVWFFGAGSKAAQFGLYEQAAKTWSAAGRPSAATAETFRATVCAATPCVLVEAGGLAFVVGAGDGAAAGLARLGLLRPDLDGVVLTDINLVSIGGLADIRHDTWRAGRKTPLPVFGPPGIERVVDGVNSMLLASDILEAKTVTGPPLSPDGAPLAVGRSQGSEGVAGTVVFDSGVVAIRSFPVAEQPSSWVYRFDFNNQSLIVAGCGARQGDILAAARGASQANAILPAASEKMLEIDRAAASRARAGVPRELAPPGGQACLSHEDAIAALRDARLSGGLLAPLYPPAVGPAAVRTWRELVTAPPGLSVAAGEAGDSLNLSGDKPVIESLRRGGAAMASKAAANQPIEPASNEKSGPVKPGGP